jgi:hypothetical protein
MSTYTVKYKQMNSFFWKKINNVKGDLTLTKDTNPIRVLILSDETRIEIPASNHIFCFSKERFFEMLKSQEKEIGQKISVNSN